VLWILLHNRPANVRVTWDVLEMGHLETMKSCLVGCIIPLNIKPDGTYRYGTYYHVHVLLWDV
jgi:hypothetical protein